MNLRRQFLTLPALLTALTGSLIAQVEKVAIHTTGISCGFCAVMSEAQFRRMPSLQDVAVNLRTETITLSCKSGTRFGPRELRDVLQRLNVGVRQFQVSARGRSREESGKRLFVAGRDKFILAEDACSLPADTPLQIEGIVNDRMEPMELKVVSFRLVDSK
jgi:hypothetical protein